jgi:hypothetical protein
MLEIGQRRRVSNGREKPVSYCRAFPVRGWFLLVVGILAVGCSGGASDRDTKGPDIGTFVERRARLLSKVECRALYETCNGKPPPSRARLETPVDTCLERNRERFTDEGLPGGRTTGFARSTAASVDAERLEYDPAAAADCLDKLRRIVDNFSCVQNKMHFREFFTARFRRLLAPSCRRALAPTQKRGEQCAADTECVSPLWCDGGQRPASKCGTCRPRADGGPAELELAGRGDECSGSNNSGVICNPRDDLGCALNPNSQAGGTCAPLLTRDTGQSCKFGLCKRGNVCHTGTCKNFQLRETGESCGDKFQVCAASLWCRDDGSGSQTCRSPGDVGDRCTESRHCAGDLWCHPETGACRELAAEGEPCVLHGCRDGLYCHGPTDGEVGTCRPTRDEGESCYTTGCSQGLFCEGGSRESSGVCIDPVKSWEPACPPPSKSE